MITLAAELKFYPTLAVYCFVLHYYKQMPSNSLCTRISFPFSCWRMFELTKHSHWRQTAVIFITVSVPRALPVFGSAKNTHRQWRHSSADGRAGAGKGPCPPPQTKDKKLKLKIAGCSKCISLTVTHWIKMSSVCFVVCLSVVCYVFNTKLM